MLPRRPKILYGQLYIALGNLFTKFQLIISSNYEALFRSISDQSASPTYNVTNLINPD